MVCRISRCHFLWLVAALFLAGRSNGLFGQMLYVGNAGERSRRMSSTKRPVFSLNSCRELLPPGVPHRWQLTRAESSFM
jgi:hypothetical protein